MKSWSTLILALVALALLAFFYFGGKELPSTTEREEAARRVVNLNSDKVTRIELANASGEFVLVKDAAGTWRLEKPLATAADDTVVSQILGDVEFARRRSTLDPRAFEDYAKALESFGLKSPKATAKFQQDGKAWTIAIGNDTARGGQAYALTSDGKREDLVIVDSSLAENLLHGLDRLRSRAVFNFQTPSVQAITLRRGDQAVEVLREADQWKIVRPLEAPAETARVTGWLGQLLGARAVAFVDDAGADAARYGLAAPSALVEVRAAEGTQVLRIGQPVAGQDAIYVQRVGEGAGVVTLPKASVDLMLGLLEQVRDRRLAAFGDVFEFSAWRIERRGGLLLEGKAGTQTWILGGFPGHEANVALVNAFLFSLRDQPADGVITKTPDALKRAGLDNPQAVVTLTPQRRDAEGPEPQPVVIRFGATRKGGKITVESSRLPYLVEMSDSILALLPGGGTDWHARTVKLVPTGQSVTRLAWKRPAGEIVLTRADDGSWKNAQGQTVDQAAVERVLNLLNAMETTAWMPAKEADFAKPRTTLEFSTGPDSSRMLDLVLLGRDAQNRVRLRGDTAAFSLAAQDFQVLDSAPGLAP